MSNEIIRSNTIENIINDINKTPDLRARALIVHLYIENIINHIIQKKFPKNPNKIEKFRFDQKLEILVGLGVISKELSNNVKVINRVRNLFAHRLDINSGEFKQNFISDLNEIDISKFVENYDKDNTPPDAALFMCATHLIHNLFDGYEKV